MFDDLQVEIMDYSQYPEKWQKRFAFFDENGAPHTATYKEKLKALKAAEGFGAALKINFNFFAFFFGFIYFFVIGLWKKGLVLLGIGVVLGIITAIIEALTGLNLNVIGIVIGIYAGLVANYSYYLKEVKKKDDWNILDGWRP